MPTIVLSPLTHDNPVQAEHHGLALPYIHALSERLASHLEETQVVQVQPGAADPPDLHLALHSNIAHDSLSGMLRGISVLHPPGDETGAQAAAVFAQRLKEVYPLPQYVRAEESAFLEPSADGASLPLLLELGYQDNSADAAFFQYRREEVVLAITRAVTHVLHNRARPPADSAPADNQTRPPANDAAQDSPPGAAVEVFASGAVARQGLARAPFGGLVLRALPEGTAPILATAPNHSLLTILETVGDWYLLRYGSTTGYANRSLVALL